MASNKRGFGFGGFAIGGANQVPKVNCLRTHHFKAKKPKVLPKASDLEDVEDPAKKPPKKPLSVLSEEVFGVGQMGGNVCSGIPKIQDGGNSRRRRSSTSQ
jgi:hypothetical protein